MPYKCMGTHRRTGRQTQEDGEAFQREEEMANPVKPAGRGSSPSGSGTGWAIHSSGCLLGSADPRGQAGGSGRETQL